jgi:hypothetical protein
METNESPESIETKETLETMETRETRLFPPFPRFRRRPGGPSGRIGGHLSHPVDFGRSVGRPTRAAHRKAARVLGKRALRTAG